MNQEQQIQLALPASKIQYLLSVLAKRPYEEAAELIGSIVNQANQQTQPMQAEEETKQPVRKKRKTNGADQPSLQ